MKFVLSAAGKLQEVTKEGVLYPLVEKGRDAGTHMSEEMMQWILTKLGAMFHDLGIWLLHISPDTLLMLSMIFCLGAICSIPKTGKWAAAALAAGVVMEVVRGAVGA